MLAELILIFLLLYMGFVIEFIGLEEYNKKLIKIGFTMLSTGLILTILLCFLLNFK